MSICNQNRWMYETQGRDGRKEGCACIAKTGSKLSFGEELFSYSSAPPKTPTRPIKSLDCITISSSFADQTGPYGEFHREEG